MQKRSTIFIEFFLVIIAIGSLAYYKFYYAPRHVLTPSEYGEVEVLVDKEKYVITSIKEQPEYSIIDVEYPFFPDAPSSFNEQVRNYVIAKITEHNNISKENWDSRFNNTFAEENFPEKPLTEEDKMPFFMKTEIIQANRRAISFVLRYATYQSGMLASEEVVSFNFDGERKKDVLLKDLFDNDPLYLEDISRFVQKDLTERFVTADTLADLGLDKETQEKYVSNSTQDIVAGTLPVITNFNTFTFTPSEIIFYFQPNQIGSQIPGIQKSSMPRK